MTSDPTILITAPSSRIIEELAQRRPAWQILEIDDPLAVKPYGGPLWGYIDWICPKMSGLEMCRLMRSAEPTRRAHLTMVLTEPNEEIARRALEAGADDYTIGPLSAYMIIDRAERERETGSLPRRRFAKGVISLDAVGYQTRVNGALVPLRPNEFRLLQHFLSNPDRVFSRSELIDCLGKDAKGIDERTVDVWVGRLRRALIAQGAPDPLRTVRSVGYVLDSD